MFSNQLSVLTKHHLDQAIALSQAENWPHRREDWEMLLDLSRGSVALRDNVAVGTALRTDYGRDVSLLNMIIVRQSERGQGLGRKLMESLMDEVTDHELRLVATKAGLPLYEKLGFHSEGEIAQCQGNITAISPSSSQVSSADVDDVSAIIKMDCEFVEADRSALIQWLAQKDRLAVTRGEGGEITGYAVLRRFGRGHVIGPIQAASRTIAQDLICYFAAGLTGEFIRIDTDDSLGLSPWLESIALKRVAVVTKMRKNAKTDPQPSFGLCSQALG